MNFLSGPELTVGTIINGDSSQSEIAALSNGGFVVTWIGTADGGNSSGILSQLYDSTGAAIGAAKQVNTFTTGNQFDQSVTGLADGGYVITWTSTQHEGSSLHAGFEIYARRYDASGNPLGDEQRIAHSLHNSTAAPEIASLTDGGYVITWAAQTYLFTLVRAGMHFDKYDNSLVAAQFDSLGNLTRQMSVAAQQTSSKIITGLSDGGYLIGWSQWGGNGLSIQRYDASGQAIGAADPILHNDESAGPRSPGTITGLEDGGYIVTWTARGPDSHYGIYGHRYDASGAPVGSAFQVNSYTNSGQSYPAATAIADGGFMLTWSSFEQDGSEWGIYGQRYDSFGVPAGSEFLINSHTNGSQLRSSVTSLSNGSFVVSWSSEADDGLSWNVGVKEFHSILSTSADDSNNSLLGTAAADFLNGAGGNDELVGRAGNDVLSGGAGSDDLYGGAGSDILSADRELGFDNFLDVDLLSGGTGDDFLFAGFGDIVDGGAGSDTLSLSYVGASAGINGDTKLLHQGTPLVPGGGTLQSIERIADLALTQFDDRMVIGDQRDSAAVRGWDGDDYLIGQLAPLDMFGGNGNDTLVGGTANDRLYGDNGNDTLMGYLGTDQLWGGAGNDRFMLTHLNPTTHIRDFEHGIDKIDVSGIDANTSLAGDQAFTFIGSGAFSGASGELRYGVAASSSYYVEGDINGDRIADFIIDLDAVSTVTSVDFLF